jgi:putative transposase
VARRRAQWTKRQSGIDPKRLVFIDETWTKTNMEPLRGWAPKGDDWWRKFLTAIGKP